MSPSSDSGSSGYSILKVEDLPNLLSDSSALFVFCYRPCVVPLNGK